MPKYHLRTASPRFTASGSLLSLAFIVGPALLVISRPIGYASALLATAIASICLTLAWVTWKRSSDVSNGKNAILRIHPKPRNTIMWKNPCVLNLPIVCALLSSPLLFAGDLSRYRDFQFGTNLARVAKLADLQPSEAMLIHARPAKIQELGWHPYFVERSSGEADPVMEGLFTFYNDQLFRMVITYDRYKIEGMTVEDMVQSISAVYGVAAATPPNSEVPFHSNYAESAPVLARWENPEYSCSLIRTRNQFSFALVLVSKRLDTLAQTAIAESARLDAQEAPQRAIDLQNKREENVRLAMEQVRSVNKPKFRP